MTKFEENEINLNHNLLNFVTDGLKFDNEVVKSTCAHTLAYNATDGIEIFKNKTQLSNNVRILQKNDVPKPLRKWPKLKSESSLKAIEYEELINEPNKPAKINFQKNNYFEVVTKAGRRLAGSLDRVKSFAISEITTEESKDDIGVFLTEATIHRSAKKNLNIENVEMLSKSLTNIDLKSDNSLKKDDWDNYLISKLSENTARWIVSKKTDRKFIFKEKLKVN